MKRLLVIVACAICFVLGTLAPVRNTHAQTNTPIRTFYQISFMKTRPGQDSLKMERELWKSVQTSRLNSGQINSWTVMQPVFAGAHPYDYITVEGFNSLDTFVKTDYSDMLAKLWGKEKFQSGMTQTMNARDMLGNEIWEVVESVSKQNK